MAAAAAVTGSPVRGHRPAQSAVDVLVRPEGCGWRAALAPGASVEVSLPAQPVLVTPRRVS